MGLQDWLRRRRIDRSAKRTASLVTREMLDQLADEPPGGMEWREDRLQRQMDEEWAKLSPEEQAEAEAEQENLAALETKLRGMGVYSESDDLFEDYLRESWDWENDGRGRPTYYEWLVDHAQVKGWL